MYQYRPTCLTLPAVAVALLLSSCDSTAPVAEVSFSKQIQPILTQHCLKCHDEKGEGTVASGLRLSGYETLLQGTKFGPVIKPGDSLSSTLIILVEGRANPSINMPHGNQTPLNSGQIQTLRQWIDQGARNN
ncbi:MAG: hypothetical protein L3J84_01315 [Gammaproteobacteria bacterium]|nr:hypothetical protein [Gammaproteobacteria bacterium]